MRKTLLAIACGVAAMAFAVPAVASADSVSTNFEGFNLGTVNGQDGWKSAAQGNLIDIQQYDHEVVANGAGAPMAFGTKSLRMSNGYNPQAIHGPVPEFEYQTYSKPVTQPAGEGQANTEYTAEFSFISTSPSTVQDQLHMSVSPDNGHGARMSYIGLTDTATGTAVMFYDVDGTGTFVGHDLGTLSKNVPHTIKFWIKFNAGADNDVVRIFIDNKDVGQCFKTWETYYRLGEGHEPSPSDRLLFLSGSTGTIQSLVGNGYLFDNVTTTTANGPGPASCGLKAGFCSPGFWKNASDAAWAQVAPVTKSSLFNSVVVPDAYGKAISPPTTTLWDVLNAKSATTYGKVFEPLGLNPYNAVGAALTNLLPGYTFGSVTDPCPLNNKGVPIPS